MAESVWGISILGLACLVSFVLVAGVSVIFLTARWMGKPKDAATAARWCPTCGGELPRDAPEGLCPRCLLKEAFRSPPPSLAPRLNQAGTAPHQGSFTAPSLADLAQRFPHLEIIDLLGQGGMGAVYKARQTKLDRAVALKILPPEAGTDSAFADRFTREARALAKLSHPNIVGVHDFGDAGGLFYLLMEYVDGLNLRQLMQAGRLDPHQALSIVGQICDALQYAHDEGIVHRDIKPENILLDQRGRVKIADFGLAKLLHRTPVDYSLTGTKQVMGTPHYMAPEQMEKPQTVDHRADIYSLGVLFYEMLTGELPLGRFALPSEKSGGDARLDEIVLRALEKEPERRYQRVSELKTAVEALSGALPYAPAITVLPASSYQEELDLEMLRLQVRGPAAGLMLTAFSALVQWTATGIYLHPAVLQPDGLGGEDVLWGLLLLLVVGLLLFAGWKMKRFESHDFVSVASTWAMLPWSAACVVGIPFGIWALVVLQKPEVKAAFVRNALRKRRKAAPIPPSSNLDHEMLRLQVTGPAVALIVVGILALIFWAVIALTFMDGERHWWTDDSRGYNRVHLWSDLGYGAVMALFVLGASGMILLGARRLMRFENYSLCLLAAILAMLPWSLAWPVGIGIGAWTLGVLRQPHVKLAFLGQFAAPSPLAAPSTARNGRGKWRSLWQGIQSLFIASRVEGQTGDWAEGVRPDREEQRD